MTMNGGAALTDVSALHEILKGYVQGEVVELTHPATDGEDRAVKAPVLVLPKELRVESVKKYLDEMRLRPERRTGTARLLDVASFIAHVKAFRFPSSKVFAVPSETKPRLLAVYDYHEEHRGIEVAEWCQHRARYAPKVTEEWKFWLGLDGKELAQAEFAAVIEDRIGDFVVADAEDAALQELARLVEGRFASPSALMQMSRGLSLNVDLKVKNIVNLGTGEATFQYEEVHNDGTGQPLKVANLAVLAIPVFEGGPRYRLPVRIRYRHTGGRVAWTFRRYRADLVFRAAFDEIVQKVRDETELPVLLGVPEGTSEDE